MSEDASPDPDLTQVTTRLATAADHDAVVACVRAAYTPYVAEIGVAPAPSHDDYAAHIAHERVWLAVRSNGEVVVEGAAVTAGFTTATSTLDNLACDVSGVPGAVISLIVDPLRAQLASTAGAAVAQVLPPRVSQFYADFFSR